MVFNPETQHIINFVNDSISNFPLEYQLPIIRELYQIAIDPYTFRKELQWYFETSITGPNLLYGVRKHKGKKEEFLKEVNWKQLTRYYINLFKNDADIHFSEVLSSYHQKRYLKDDTMLDSGRYVFEKPKYAKSECTLITLKAPEKIGAQRG